jgi:hypothetical protein
MVVNSRGSNGSKSSCRVYKIISLIVEPYLTSVHTPLPTASRHRSPPRRARTPLPTTLRRRSPPCRAALHRLHSPPHHTTAPHRIPPALHSPPRVLPLLDLAAAPRPHRLTQFLHRAPRRVIVVHLLESLSRTTSSRRLLRTAPGACAPTPRGHGRFWRIHQRRSLTLWLCFRR